MKLIHSPGELSDLMAQARFDQRLIGFVPTMGALHPGHLSLVERASEMSDFVVVSIFVNPTQFNDPNDLMNYPRNLAKDLLLLQNVKVDAVFAPEVHSIYPEPDTRNFDFGMLENVMEGKHRPGHFKGVAQVVTRLFDMVDPDLAFFGEKDFQQLAIIQEMVRMLHYRVKIVPCPIVRESDGLAMSSRNQLLNPSQRKEAVRISQVLTKAGQMSLSHTIQDVINMVKQEIGSSEILLLEYFEVVDSRSLQPAESWDQENGTTGCIAVFAGKVRLIDNIQFRPSR